MPNEQRFEIRDLRNGDWCWIHKAVIQEYTQKIGAIGITVYNFLASLADRCQGCFPSQKYIAKSLGYSRSYINETLKALERNKLIRIEKRGRYHRVYHLLKVRCRLYRTQVSTIANSGVNYSDTNNNKRTRNNNNIDIEGKSFSNRKTFRGFRPKTRQELLALDLADALNDHKGLALYLSYARKYPESLLRKVLGEVKEIPVEKIKKSRAALFNYLIKQYAKKASNNHRD
ncbi:MAG: helix-turn-helix domain-containing protein [Candidatus Zixiibacteriota bacterium]